jgi:hypothetical protein
MEPLVRWEDLSDEEDEEMQLSENYSQSDLFEILSEQILNDIEFNRSMDPSILEEQERVWIQCPCDVPSQIQKRLCHYIYLQAGLPIFWISPDSMVIEYFTRKELKEIHRKRESKKSTLKKNEKSTERRYEKVREPPEVLENLPTNVGKFDSEKPLGSQNLYTSLPLEEKLADKDSVRDSISDARENNKRNPEEKISVEKDPSGKDPGGRDPDERDPDGKDPGGRDPEGIWQTQSKRKKRIEKPREVKSVSSRFSGGRATSQNPRTSVREFDSEKSYGVTSQGRANSTSGSQRGRRIYH